MSELLTEAGVPEDIQSDKDAVIDYLARRVIALSIESGREPEILDEEQLSSIEARTYEVAFPMATFEIYQNYCKSYIDSLSTERAAAVKAALRQVADARNISAPDHWM